MADKHYGVGLYKASSHEGTSPVLSEDKQEFDARIQQGSPYNNVLILFSLIHTDSAIFSKSLCHLHKVLS